MSTKTLHGQLTVIDDNGNIKKLHQETSAQDVLIKKDTNTQSAIPSDVDNLQKLSDKLGNLAFKSTVANADLDGNFVVADETEEGVTPPESEINDDVISSSLTWSSNKINTQVTALTERIEEVNAEANSILYVTLLEDSNGGYTSQKTVAEIEAAYQSNKAIWIQSNEVLLPLRKRVDVNTWVFSGYIGKQAYDFTITATGVTKTATTLATTADALPNPNPLKLVGAVNVVYDGSEEIEVPQEFVKYTSQELTDEQKLQARTNINAAELLTEDDALELVAELGIAEPMTDESGNVLTDENGDLFTL